MARLVLHIGCAKGGSTSIQRMLRENAHRLLEEDVVVGTEDLLPDSKVTGYQIDYMGSCLARNAVNELESRVLATFESRPDATLIVSAENLCNPHGFEKLFVGLAEKVSTTIVFYVRRQDEYFESAWLQWYVKSGISLRQWLIESVGRVGDWNSYIGRWVDSVVADYRVRKFDRASLINGNLYEDFCDAAQLTYEAIVEPAADANVSLAPIIARWWEGTPWMFESIHDHRLERMLETQGLSILREKSAFKPLLNRGERVAVMERFAESNESLRVRFFPDYPSPLFDLDRAHPGDGVGAQNEERLRIANLEYMLLSRDQKETP